jgi:hypothetical protein
MSRNLKRRELSGEGGIRRGLKSLPSILAFLNGVAYVIRTGQDAMTLTPKTKQATNAAQKKGLLMVMPEMTLSPVAVPLRTGLRTANHRKISVPITKMPDPRSKPRAIHMEWVSFRSILR